MLVSWACVLTILKERLLLSAVFSMFRCNSGDGHIAGRLRGLQVPPVCEAVVADQKWCHWRVGEGQDWVQQGRTDVLFPRAHQQVHETRRVWTNSVTGFISGTSLPYPSFASCIHYADLNNSDCLEVKREYYQNCTVLGYVTQCSQSAAHSCEQFLQVEQIQFVTLGPLRHA